MDEIIEEMERYSSELDYLEKSMGYLITQRNGLLGNLKEDKKDLAELKADMKVIKNARFKKAGMNAVNSITANMSNTTNLLKDVDEDQKWVRRCLRIVKVWYEEAPHE